MTTIRIHNKAEARAEGNRTNGNCKAVFCITTGEVFTSLLDAAEYLNCSPSTLSSALTHKTKTCKGRRFCFVTEITEHLEEIADHTRTRNVKVAHYDKMMYKKEALNRAMEHLAKHRARLDKLNERVAKEMQLVAEAEREVNLLKENNETEEF